MDGKMKTIRYKDHSYIGYCVYLLINNGKVVYVGCTCNLAKRLGEHIQWYPYRVYGRKALIDYKGNERSSHYVSWREEHIKESKFKFRIGLCKKVFTHYSYIPVKSRHEALRLEQINIKKYCPKYNDINNYQWIPSKKRDLLEEGMDEPRYYYLMTLRKRRVPKIKQSLKTRNALIERYEY